MDHSHSLTEEQVLAVKTMQIIYFSSAKQFCAQLLIVQLSSHLRFLSTPFSSGSNARDLVLNHLTSLLFTTTTTRIQKGNQIIYFLLGDSLLLFQIIILN